jgi:cytochrome P450
MESVRNQRIDPEEADLLQDPYPIYARLRRDDPVHWSERNGRWLLTRHADVVSVLRDDGIFRKESEEERGQARARSMLRSDPPDHTRLRGLVSRAFTARRVEELRTRIEGLVEDLLDRVSGRDEIDFIDEFAYPLPITVIAELLGVPPEDQDQFRRWSYGIALRLGATVTETDEAVRRGVRQYPGPEGGGLMSYFTRVLEQRRAEPSGDLITALIAAEDEGDRLSHAEVLSMLVLLLVAGHETTVNLLGNGMYALLCHPDQLSRFREDPGLAKTAIEEFLRYDSPVQRTGRIAAQDVEIGGKTIPAGQWVSTLIGAANRDPDVYAEPDELDLGRQPNPHVSFAAGIHFCLGAQLARLEGQVAFPKVLERFPRMRLATDADLPYRPAPVLRGLEALPIKL